MTKSNYKELATIAAIVVGAVAVYKISGGVSKAIENVGEGLGGGVGSLLGGAGAGVASAGQGIEYLGQGAGAGVAGLGQGVGAGIAGLGVGVGGGLFQVGSGVYEIGKGAGYAVSGANIQDVIQTILTLGKGEASTYQAGTNSTIKLTPDMASNQGQYSGAGDFAKSQASLDIPTSSGTYDAASGVFTSRSGQKMSMAAAPSGAKILNAGAGTFTQGGQSYSGTPNKAPIPIPTETTPNLISIITGNKALQTPTPPIVQGAVALFNRIFRR